MGEKDYDADVFTSDQLLASSEQLPALTQTSYLSFFELFPQLGERISHIANLNLKKNFQNRIVVDQIYEVTKLPAGLVQENAQMLKKVFSQSLINSAQIHEDLSNLIQDQNLLNRPNEISESLKKFKKEMDLESKNIKTPIIDFILNERYSDMLKLSIFFESCFFYSFSICFYSSQYKQINPNDNQMDSFFDFSIDLLIYVCRLGRALIRKINEFDNEKNIDNIHLTFGNDQKNLKKEIKKLEKYKENN